jgi:predicted NAD/FAD-binding protein
VEPPDDPAVPVNRTLTEMPPPLRVAVVGSGISGLTAAYALTTSGHQVRLFESEATLGGHATTVEVGPDNLPVDIGFIVYNEVTYPRFIGLLAELGVPTQASDMSMGVACGMHRVEWSTRGLRGVFARPMQLALPSHYRMLGDLFRFYRDARILLDTDARTGMTLDEYLDDRVFGRGFAAHFLVPLTAAVWSTAPDTIGSFPIDYLLRFLDHHGLIGYGRALQWRTIKGGSREYVSRIAERLGPDAISLGDPVRAVVRDADGAMVLPTRGPAERFDAVVMATHADVAARLLRDADPDEAEALGGFEYSDNRVVLHTDAGILPRRQNAWASWNIDMGSCAAPGDALTMTYHMNRLQSLASTAQYSVSLNPPDGRIRDDEVLLERDWSHPLYTFGTLRSQDALRALQGHRRTWYAGAHLGYGFHEDGCRAGYEAAESIIDAFATASEERAA